MDGSMSISPETAQNLQSLSDKDKQELNQFIQHESTYHGIAILRIIY
jgi:hypothetical protein